jgi:hypothetical protein
VPEQPVFAAEYVEKRSRLTTFFRALLAIPHFIALAVWGVIVYVAVIIAWFALLITGRYPAVLYDFVAGFARYAAMVSGYYGLLTDRYPAFSSDPGDYPVQLRTPPAKDEYNRLKVLFRIVLMIPVMIISYAMAIVWELGSLIAWFAIVVLGRQPRGLQDMIVLGMSYQQRALPYLLLLTEDWPPFTDAEGGTLPSGRGGSLSPAPTYAAPAASDRQAGDPRPGTTSGDPLNG